MNRQGLIAQISFMVNSISKPSRGVEPDGRPTLSFTISVRRDSFKATKLTFYYCKIIIDKDKSTTLIVDDNHATIDDTEKIHSLLTDSYRASQRRRGRR